MYQLDSSVATQIKNNVMSGYKEARNTYFPGNSLSLFILQFVFVGFLGGLFVKLLSPKTGSSSNPEYH
ncbi:MAG: hypothetical protein DLD55_05420 [candidate division SR1 bacterium]|nr:MAG: hypothetical protein DLD55_05420 [candidate division SR1 bacterium]